MSSLSVGSADTTLAADRSALARRERLFFSGMAIALTVVAFVGFAPTYYLHSDAPLYYYSFTDAYIAASYRSLTPQEQGRFDPMITGFNPADMYGVDHIRRVLKTFPGVFTGIGEFSIHKEFVSSKIRPLNTGMAVTVKFAPNSLVLLLVSVAVAVILSPGLMPSASPSG